MVQEDFPQVESPTENYQPKVLCVLTVDVSYSMEGKPIAELNQGLQQFYDDVKQDKTAAERLEFAIVAFNDEIKTILEPSLVDNFAMPTLQAKGSTRLVDGVREAIALIETRKMYYKNSGIPYYRPWIILITDGEPDRDQDIQGLAKEINRGVDDKHFWFFAIGVQNANMSVLEQISSPKMPPARLAGLKFSEFFRWLSNSLGKISQSKMGDKVQLDSPAAWMDGFNID